MKRIFIYIACAVVGIFASIGFLFTAVFFAMQYDLLNVRGSITERNEFFPGADTLAQAPECQDASKERCAWQETPEWEVVSGGLRKDEAIIARVAQEVGVSERMIAAVVVPEQTRFFTSNREVFKRYFEPLKILGSLSQFSLGVSGIKEDTAKTIERYANDPQSDFYPGEGIAALIAYPEGADHSQELYRRLTDAKDHYYSYLYTAIYIKEVQEQWRRAGYDISQNAGAVVTLFNIGFQGSNPNPTPRAAGAVIATGGQSYTYGELGALFYASGELVDIFPR